MFKCPHHPWAWLPIALSRHPSTLHQASNSKRTLLFGHCNMLPTHPHLVNASSLTVTPFMLGLYPFWKKWSSLLLMRHLPKFEVNQSYLLQMLVQISQMDTHIVISAVENATFWVSSCLRLTMSEGFNALTVILQCDVVKHRQTKRNGTVEWPCVNKYCQNCLKRRYNKELEGCANGVASFFTWENPSSTLYLISIWPLSDVRVAKVYAIARDVRKCWGGNYILAHQISLGIHPFPVL